MRAQPGNGATAHGEELPRGKLGGPFLPPPATGLQLCQKTAISSVATIPICSPGGLGSSPPACKDPPGFLDV